MKVIKKIGPRGKMFLNPGIKSTAKLIKNECRIGLAKRRSMIKTRSLNLLINPGTGNKESNSNNSNGLSINKRAVNYFAIPAKLHDLFKKSREWTKFASQKKETKLSIPAKLDTLINKDVLANQVTRLTRLVRYDVKVKPFIPDEPNALINNGTLGDQVTYLKSKLSFYPGKVRYYE
jgi:hypothetical protein